MANGSQHGGRGDLLEYHKVTPKQYPARSQRETAEGRFWRTYDSQHSDQQFGPVSCVDFCPAAPHNFAATTSTRVIVYGGLSREPRRTFSRFSDIAYSGRFRSDGKLLVAGGESSLVQVFDAGSRLVLRKLSGHKGAVHSTHFCSDKTHVISAGDDRTIRHWDMASQEPLRIFEGHEDYVRSLAPNMAAPHVWASGSYDHTVRLWDLRSPDPIMTLQHGQPVQAVSFMPSGALLASAGHNYVCVWDVLGGGRRLYTLSNHQKTVTCLAVSPPISRGPADSPLPPRLLTGSLDCHVKLYNPDNFKVVHASLYAAPILSLGISANGSTLAVGMSSGLLAVRYRKLPEKQEMALAAAGSTPRVPGLEPQRRQRRRTRVRALRASNFRYFLRGQNEKAAAEDFLVAQRRRSHLAAHDRLLRRFRYSDALTASLEIGRAEVVIAVMEELAARGGLVAAISNRDQASALPLFSFVAKHLAEPRHAPLLLPLASKLLDLYAPDLGVWPALDEQVVELKRRVGREVRLQESLVALQGMLEPIIRASTSVVAPPS